jgi:hypothetical protein
VLGEITTHRLRLQRVLDRRAGFGTTGEPLSQIAL